MDKGRTNIFNIIYATNIFIKKNFTIDKYRSNERSKKDIECIKDSLIEKDKYSIFKWLKYNYLVYTYNPTEWYNENKFDSIFL